MIARPVAHLSPSPRRKQRCGGARLKIHGRNYAKSHECDEARNRVLAYAIETRCHCHCPLPPERTVLEIYPWPRVIERADLRYMSARFCLRYGPRPALRHPN